MRALFFLHRRMLINRLGKAVKKPLVWIVTLAIAGYAVLVLSGWSQLLETMHITDIRSYAVFLMLIQLYMGVPIVMQYIKRKGIIFSKAEIQLVFQTPCNPKLFLLEAGLKSSLLLDLLLIIAGILALVTFGSVSAGFIVYVVVYVVLNFFVETSLIVLCYGNETVPDRVWKIIRWVLYLVLGAVALYAVYRIFTEGYRVDLFLQIISLPAVKLIPVFGWSMAFMQLCVFGPSWSNLLGGLLFFLSAVILPLLAWKAPCTGQYFEDAEKFSDEYMEARARARKGRVSFVGKKEKFKKARIAYKGGYARAIYYRQMLEYKKSRFFLFSIRSVIFLAIGCGMLAFSLWKGFDAGFLEIRSFVLVGLLAYFMLVFSGFQGKWAEELSSPFTFLLPDSAWKKTWNATKIDHMIALMDSVFLCLPGGLALGLEPGLILLSILIGVGLNAVHVYLHMMTVTLFGSNLSGLKGLIQVVEVFFLMIIMGICGGLAALGFFLLGSVEGAYLFLILAGLIFAAGTFGLSTLAFDRMDMSEDGEQKA